MFPASLSFKSIQKLFKRLVPVQDDEICFDSEILGEDLLIEILSKLPAKSVLRFRSVSKNWNNLTKTEYFISKSLQYHPSHRDYPCMIFQTSRRYNVIDYMSAFSMVSVIGGKTEASVLRLPEFSFVKETKELRLIGSCNGLVGLDMRFRSPIDYMFRQVMLLWNPVTKQYRILPEPNANSLFARDDIMSPLSSPTTLTGFDFVHNEYKFAKIFSEDEYNNVGHVFRAQVLERSKNSWRIVKDELRFPTREIHFFQNSLITLNGVMYFTVLRQRLTFNGSDTNYCVVSFDLRDEIFSEIELPTELRSCKNRNFNRLHSWGNSLAIFTRGYKMLWVLNSNSTWTLQFRFEGLQDMSDCIGYRRDDRFIFRRTSGDVYNKKKVCHELISYDPNTCSKYTIKRGREFDITDGVLNYVQTLAPV